MQVSQHGNTIVHVRYAHNHERHALYGRVGRHSSLPTMHVVLQMGIHDGEVQYTAQNPCDYTMHVCQYTLQHSYMHSHSMPACCTWCNGTGWYILPHQATRIFNLASWISLWCHTLPVYSTIKSYYSIMRLLDFTCMTSSTSTTHSQCMLQGWSDAPTLPYLLLHFHDSSCIFTHQCIISHK